MLMVPQQFSDVLVLSRGRVFIRGAPSTLAPQLAKRGHKLPYEISLPDFVLDLACGDFYEENSKRNAEEELQRLLQVQETEDQTHRGIRTSDVHLKQNGEVTQDPGGQLVVKPPLSWAWPSTWLNEFYVLTLRALKARSEKFLDPPFLIQVCQPCYTFMRSSLKTHVLCFLYDSVCTRLFSRPLADHRCAHDMCIVMGQKGISFVTNECQRYDRVPFL